MLLILAKNMFKVHKVEKDMRGWIIFYVSVCIIFHFNAV